MSYEGVGEDLEDDPHDESTKTFRLRLKIIPMTTSTQIVILISKLSLIISKHVPEDMFSLRIIFSFSFSSSK